MSKIWFLGWQTQEEVSKWMRQAKVFVLPSLEEGLGVVLLEALASGTPCVGSDVGGIPEVITPDVGIVVPPSNIQALQSAIETILSNESEWHRYSLNARQRAELEYSWDEIAYKLISFYRLSTN
jgi:glycosyltransferase involved in cell wall biosynthesis